MYDRCKIELLPMLATTAVIATALLVAASPTNGGVPTRRHARAATSANTLIKYVPGGSLTVPGSLAGGTLGVRELSGAVAADDSGNVYVGVCASDFRHRIVVFNRDGRYVRDFPAGNCGTGESVKIAVGPDGLLYATRIGPSDEIGVFTPDGTQVRLIGGIGRLNTVTARDIDLDSSGNIYVTIRCDNCGTDSDEVVRLSRSGAVTGRFQPLPPPYRCNGQCVKGVAPAPDGTIWVTTTDPKRELVHLDATGKALPGAPRLDVILSGLAASQIQDVDFANGRLYVVGHTKAFAVLDPSGRLVDSICCEHTNSDVDRQVAVNGKNAYVPGIATSASALERAFAAAPQSVVGKLAELGIREPKTGDSTISGSKCNGGDGILTGVPYASLNSPCGQSDLIVSNWINPCTANGYRPTPVLPGSVFVGGTQIIPSQFTVAARTPTDGSEFASIIIPRSELAPGSIVVTFTCKLPGGGSAVVSEWKGELTKTDPSGKVVDGAGKPVEGARVRLAFALRRSGPFITPGISGISPQLVTETTGRDGVFRWDVADGFWRLKVTAFGYRAFTSPVYQVPPPVTGLRLKLTQDPAEQRRLIDPGGSVGGVRLGGRPMRVPGLRLRIGGNHVRSIAVVSTRFRTARGISLGSRVRAFDVAYPASAASAAQASKGRAPTKFRILRATFRFKGGRVVGITLGR